MRTPPAVERLEAAYETAMDAYLGAQCQNPVPCDDCGALAENARTIHDRLILARRNAA